MKTAFGIPTALIFLAQAASAQPAANCAQIMSQANALSTTIERNARAYWQYRATYLGLTTDLSNAKNPQASRLADQAKLLASPMQASAPAAYSTLRGLLDVAKRQSCATPEKLVDLRESAFRSTQRVRIDRFPDQEREDKPKAAMTTLLPFKKAR